MRRSSRAADLERVAAGQTGVGRAGGEGRLGGAGRVGAALARVGLAMSACCLGVVALVVCLSTVWLMVGADDGNLTQSMSIRTWLGADTRLDLALGLVGAIVVLALCRLVWSRGRMLDGPSATWALVVGTLLFQLLVILALQARDTYWGDSWMVSDFVDEALA